MNYAESQALSSGMAALGAMIQETKLAKGWKVTTPANWPDPNQIPSDLMLIVTELAEAVEAFRENDRPAFVEELADVLIRLVGLSHGLNIDLAAASIAKAEKNRERPYRHGGKRL